MDTPQPPLPPLGRRTGRGSPTSRTSVVVTSRLDLEVAESQKVSSHSKPTGLWSLVRPQRKVPFVNFSYINIGSIIIRNGTV